MRPPLLPVTLTGGHRLTFGVWVGVTPADLQRAFAVWSQPSYRDLHLDGRLANAIRPWDVLGAPVELAVLHPDHTPYCVSSPDPALARLLDQPWPHDILEDLT